MKTNKYVAIIGLILFFLSLSLGIYFTKEDNSFKDTTNTERHLVGEKTLSMMFETETGSGKYEAVSQSEWPTDGYVFNSTLSKCENGSELSWDDVNKQVVMTGIISDECYVYFDKYNAITINSSSISLSGSSIVISIDATSGDGTISKYYYSIDGGENYTSSTNSTYTFSSLELGTYNVKAYVLDSNGYTSAVVSKTLELKGVLLADYIKSLYGGTQGNNNIYYHNGSLTNGISDNSYRYAGASGSVNNYVCISDETSCSDANLFRIIGVFGDQVKLIKATSIGNKTWNDSGTNTWSSASSNTYLNNDYLSALGNFATNYIATTTWKVGGNTYANIVSAAPTTAYKNEITSPASTTTVSKKIGLMYVSDYYYAASQTYWSKVGYSDSGSSYDYRAATGSNWLYLGFYEWTITPRSDNSISAYNVNSSGYVSRNDNGVTSSNAVRPVFYLLSTVKYVSGQGSLSSPFRLSV